MRWSRGAAEAKVKARGGAAVAAVVVADAETAVADSNGRVPMVGEASKIHCQRGCR